VESRGKWPVWHLGDIQPSLGPGWSLGPGLSLTGPRRDAVTQWGRVGRSEVLGCDLDGVLETLASLLPTVTSSCGLRPQAQKSLPSLPVVTHGDRMHPTCALCPVACPLSQGAGRHGHHLCWALLCSLPGHYRPTRRRDRRPRLCAGRGAELLSPHVQARWREPTEGLPTQPQHAPQPPKPFQPCPLASQKSISPCPNPSWTVTPGLQERPQGCHLRASRAQIVSDPGPPETSQRPHHRHTTCPGCGVQGHLLLSPSCRAPVPDGRGEVSLLAGVCGSASRELWFLAGRSSSSFI
jgi:hypothetical protein